jgi:hypothetical protein
MADNIHLVEGEEISTPGFFPNPRSRTDAKVLREVFVRYGLENIDGVVVDLADWSDIEGVLYGDGGVQGRLDQGSYDRSQRGKPISRQELIIYPDMSPLLGRSYDDENEALYSLTLEGGEDLVPRDLEIDIWGLLEQLDDATDEGMRNLRLGPIADFLQERRFIQNILEFQIKNGASFALTPSVPVTSMRDFSDQLDLIEGIFQTSNAISQGGLLSEDIDLMHTLSIKPNALRRPEDGDLTRAEEFKNVLRVYATSAVGIHLQNLDHENQERIQSLLRVISDIDNEVEIPVFLFNVDEFGLAAFSHGSGIISGPVATFPYPRFSDGYQSRKGKYYHYEDLIPYTRESLMEKTRDANYRFPCYCEICDELERITKITDTEEWNRFRRVHYLLVKDKEIKRIRETDKVLKEALRDMFANSQRSDLISYL